VSPISNIFAGLVNTGANYLQGAQAGSSYNAFQRGVAGKSPFA